jgi:chromosome segregation ATPase
MGQSSSEDWVRRLKIVRPCGVLLRLPRLGILRSRERFLEALRQSSGMASNQSMELQRVIARAQQEVEELRQGISVLEDDTGRLQSALADERRRVEGVENVVSCTRAKEAAAAERISKLSRENARLATKLNKVDARLEVASTSRRSSWGFIAIRKPEETMVEYRYCRKPTVTRRVCL